MLILGTGWSARVGICFGIGPVDTGLKTSVGAIFSELKSLRKRLLGVRLSSEKDVDVLDVSEDVGKVGAVSNRGEASKAGNSCAASRPSVPGRVTMTYVLFSYRDGVEGPGKLCSLPLRFLGWKPGRLPVTR